MSVAVDRSSPGGAAGRIGRGHVSVASGLRIFTVSGCVRAPSAPGLAAGYCPRGRSRERGVRRTRTRVRAAQARPRCDAGGERHDCAGGRGSGHRQEPAGVRAGGPCPGGGIRGPRSGAASIWSARELPYQPFVEALRPLGAPATVDERTAGSQLRVFEQTLALLTDRAATAPVLLVLEDLHWADTSTLDLVVFLAHNLDDRRVVLLATYRADEPASAERVRRLADGVRRSGSALMVELGPLERDELTALLAARAEASLPAALTDAIVARSEGNPFFAEELLAVAGDGSGELPHGLRDLLLQRVAGSIRRRRGCCASPRPPGETSATRCSARRRRCRNVTCASRCAGRSSTASWSPCQATGSFRFRHALLAEAVYATLLPGEREELHGRLAEELARSAAAAPAELAPHWAAAGRTREALAASVEAARQAEAVFGLAEALAHLERALALWAAVPDAADLVEARPRRALLPDRRARLAHGRGAARGRARPTSDRARRRRRPAARRAPARGPRPLPARKRAGRRRPRRDRARGRAGAVAATLAGARAGARGARQRADAWPGATTRRCATLRAGAPARPRGRRTRGRVPGAQGARLGLAYLGRGDEGLAHLWRALRLAEESRDPDGPGMGVRLAHRRADDAGTPARGGTTRGDRDSRRCSATGSTAPRWSPTRSRP